jgi:hypothetical protein
MGFERIDPTFMRAKSSFMRVKSSVDTDQLVIVLENGLVESAKVVAELGCDELAGAMTGRC